MYRFAKAALNLSGQSARPVAVRQMSGLSPEFHAKYGFPLMIAGAAFCTSVWAYVSDRKHNSYILSLFSGVLCVIIMRVFAGDHINGHHVELVTRRKGAAQAMEGVMNAFPTVDHRILGILNNILNFFVLQMETIFT